MYFEQISTDAIMNLVNLAMFNKMQDFITQRLFLLNPEEEKLLVRFNDNSTYYGNIKQITIKIIEKVIEILEVPYSDADFDTDPDKFSQYVIGHIAFMLDDQDFDVSPNDYFKIYVEDSCGNLIHKFL